MGLSKNFSFWTVSLDLSAMFKIKSLLYKDLILNSRGCRKSNQLLRHPQALQYLEYDEMMECSLGKAFFIFCFPLFLFLSKKTVNRFDLLLYKLLYYCFCIIISFKLEFIYFLFSV